MNPLKLTLLVLYVLLAAYHVTLKWAPWEAFYWIACAGSMAAITFGTVGK